MDKKITFLTILVFLFLLTSQIYSSAKVIGVGEKIPLLKAETWINGDINEETLKNHPLVVEFWATWCPPCRKAIPHMVKLYKEYNKKGVIFIGITGESYAKVKSFANEYKMKYHIGTGSKEIIKKFGVRAIPHVFVIGYDGKVLWSGHPGDKKFESYIKKSIKNVPKDIEKSSNKTSTKEVELKNVKKK